MLDFEDDASGREKCYTTIVSLPAFIDPKQPPTKKSPFSAIVNHAFVHTTEVLLPKEIYSSIKDSLDTELQRLRYARVFMSPSALLEGEFFNTYIKSGNVLMISEGRSGSDNVFTLRDGILRLELGKEIYERTGLTGKPIRSGGRKHAKERYLIELNLRLPSMLHGKKGFDRIVWAFKNVLDQSVAWLFYDLTSGVQGISNGDLLLKGNHPHIIDCEVMRTEHRNVLTPSFNEKDFTEAPSEDLLKDKCEDLSEWLAMVALDSPRVSKDDDIDPYLSRYSVPDNEDRNSTDLVSMQWKAFIPPSWILALFTTLLRETASKTSPASTWFALSSGALGREAIEAKDGYTILLLPSAVDAESASGGPDRGADTRTRGSRSCICWEYVGASVL
ncbi:ribonuclease P protein subunit p40 [Aspergillus clavatus NRRL 1]|uniref:Uncharacterized protein n=1 Tax=Aspergillus clavatus (strain ATCC 1007 / CBS 513.65 / DSM 816 / NCTC 3887 / NRRL 1 / QM 1276 / 107) TaxID=344612 RepID=A1CIE4_ASPCL|nr:uncharacterized protein ACLA_051210 [Aspergillus clavatus NRRL 1]EAW10649.1 conserved hypothetical protein [Aspergillus clavatus NRRL 1]